jgi:RsiW-degrading membrane proteinase PrsW (M82 family)
MPALGPAALGLAPVVVFLAALVLLDSYKLVRLRLVVTIVAAGMAVAGACLLVNATLIDGFSIPFQQYTRYVAPLVEEALKAFVVVVLIRMNRIGFLVDAAILGFAVGTGFALVENLYYLQYAVGAGMGTWLARGFGTAIMHGGATAIFAVITVATLEKKATAGAVGRRRTWGAQWMGGYAIAVVLHSIFNHFFFSPLASTVGIAIAFPVLLNLVFTRSEAAVGDWLGKGFDADTEMLELINSGRFSDSPVGRYLTELKEKFQGPVVADLLCYLRLYTELALRAKGILMMRESGFEVPVDDATREKFAELRYLEKSVGRTALLAIQPMLHMSHKELWQLYMLGK